MNQMKIGLFFVDKCDSYDEKGDEKYCSKKRQSKICHSLCKSKN